MSEDILDELVALIQDRQTSLPEDSYTTALLTDEKGANAVLEKLGEEMTEVILAAKDQDAETLTAETADLIYHLLVLLVMNDVDLDAVRAELRDRR